MTLTGLKKVTAFVVSRDARILVFRHPLAGTQLPAGTVELGEEVSEAARREVYEETGWSVAGTPQFLGCETLRLEGGWGVMLETISEGIVRQGGAAASLVRGHKVRLSQRREQTIEVSEEIYDLADSPPTLKDAISGWVPARVVGDTIERSFVLFYEERDARCLTSWHRHADGHIFEVCWAPLDSVALVAGQDAWLQRHRHHILRSTSPR